MAGMTGLFSLELELGVALSALVAIAITWGTLAIARIFRRRSAPTREVLLRTGLCLLIGWPVLVAGGVLASPWLRSRGLVTGESPLVITTVTSPNSSRTVFEFVPVSPQHQETKGEVWTPQPLAIVSENTIVGTPIGEMDLAQDTMLHVKTGQTGFFTILRGTLQSVIHWGGLVWFVGIFVSGLILLRDGIRIRSLRKQFKPCPPATFADELARAMHATGLRKAPMIVHSDEIGSPCVSGVWRPQLILPSRMLDRTEADDSLEAILIHECAHIARRDVAWALVGRLVRVVYWWEPGLGRLLRELAQLREEICDNHVLGSTVDPRRYARALLDLAAAPRVRPLLGVIGMVDGNNPLSDRVERLLQEAPERTTRVGRMGKIGLVGGLLIVGVMVFATSARFNGTDVSAQVPKDPVASVNVDFASAQGEAAASEFVEPEPSRDFAAGELEPPTESVPPRGSLKAIEPPDFEQTNNEPVLGPSLSPPVGSRTQRPFRQRSIPATPREVPPSSLPFGTEPTPFDVPEIVITTITLETPNAAEFAPHDRAAMTITIPAGDHFLPKTIRFEGLTVNPPPPASAQVLGLELPSLPTTTPPAPPEAVAAKPTVTFQVPPHFAAVWTALQARGATATIAKLGPGEAQPHSLDARPGAIPIPQSTTFRISIEALANEMGQLRAFQWWGRATPDGGVDTGLAPLGPHLAAWKTACLAMDRDPNGVPFPAYIVELKIADTMRYGDVRAILKTIEDQGLQVAILSDTASKPDHRPTAIAPVKLTRVYNKEGQPVGSQAVLLAEKANSPEVQLVTTTHWDEALRRFAQRYPNAEPTLLITADPDLPYEALESFISRAQLAHVQRIIIQADQELLLDGDDQLVPLIDDSQPRPSDGFNRQLRQRTHSIPETTPDLFSGLKES